MSGRDFEGFTVVVTGGSTGLGRAIAVETARRGAGLVVINFARSSEEAEETARLVEAEGAKAVLAQGDVSSDEDCRRIAAAVPLRRFGERDFEGLAGPKIPENVSRLFRRRLAHVGFPPNALSSS